MQQFITSGFHHTRRAAAVLGLAAIATLANNAGAAVDQFQFYFNSTVAQGGTNAMGGFSYDSGTNQFWTAGFTGATSQALRKISFSGSWSGTANVGQTAWVNQYLASTSLTGTGTIPAGQTASNAVGDILLNPKTVVVEGISYAPGTLALMVDQTTNRNSGNVIQPADSKWIYAYDLRQVGAAAGGGRDRNGDGTVQWNDAFSTISTMADFQTVASSSSTSGNIARRFAFSSDGQSIYLNDAATNYGGIWKQSLTTPGSAGLTRIVTDVSATNINTEPDVIAITGIANDGHRNLGSGAASGDQILFQGSGGTGNTGGINYVVDNGSSISSVNTLLTAKQVSSFIDYTGGVGNVGGITHDAAGNIYFYNANTIGRGLFILDTNGRVAKIANTAEIRVNDAANGATTFNDTMLDTKTRSVTVGPLNLTQVLYNDASSIRTVMGVNAYTPGDFNRDGAVNAADVTLLLSSGALSLRGATTFSIATATPFAQTGNSSNLKYDLNGSYRGTGLEISTVDWKDVKIFQQYAGLSDGDVNLDYAVDNTDLNTIGTNYGLDTKLFTDGNLTSVRIAASDKDVVNFADLITLAANWTAAKPALAAVGSISAADIDRAFAITSSGTISQLTNFAGGALTWSTSGNWSTGVPNGAGAVASLLTKPFNDVNLDVDGSYTLGQLNFDSYFSYTLSGSGTLHFDGNGTTAEINTIAQSPVISAGVAIDQNTNINQTYSADTITFSGPLSIAAGKTLTKNGGGVLAISGTQSHGAGSSLAIAGGTLNLSSDASNGGSATLALSMASGTTANISVSNKLVSVTNAGTVNITAGTSSIGPVDGAGTLAASGATTVGAQHVRQAVLSIGTGSVVNITASGAASGVSKVDTLTIGTSGLLNLHDNDLVVSYGVNPTPYTAIVNHVKSGLVLLGGAGTTGITSTEVDAQTITGTVLAVVDDGHPDIAGGITSLSGYTIPNPTTSVLVKYTWFGDANLDGIVTGSDYALTDTGFTSGGLLGGWVFGDYDYNGTVDGGDYALQDTGFIAQTGALPEPATLGLLGLGALGLNRRRRVLK